MRASGGTNFNAAVKELLSFIGSRGGDANRAGIALFMSDGHPAGNQHAKDDDLQGHYIFWVYYALHRRSPQASIPITWSTWLKWHVEGTFQPQLSRMLKDKFTQLFNFGKTIWYSAPTIELNISNGVTLSDSYGGQRFGSMQWPTAHLRNPYSLSRKFHPRA